MPMTSEPNTFADRRRLKRGLMFWRIAAVVLAVAALAALALLGRGGSGSLALGEPHVARVFISGLITEDEKQLEMLRKIRKSNSTKALILRINSTGGTTTGGEAIFNEVREIAKTKPVVAVFGTVAASAGYMVGAAADHIFARANSITGSIGVIVQWVEVTELLEKLGVNVNVQRSGRFKAVPSPLEKTSPEGLQVTREMVEESNKWFQDLVKSRRKIDLAQVPGLTEGAIFSGRKALEYKLIDGIGGEPQALDWLQKNRDIPTTLKVIEWKPKRDRPFSLLGATTDMLSRIMGTDLGKVIGMFTNELGSTPIHLDGMLSVWHPADSEKKLR